MKKILALILTLLMVVPLVACGESKANEAVEDAIKPVMDEYGLDDYEVISGASDLVEIKCESFKYLRDKEQYEVLKAIKELPTLEIGEAAVKFYFGYTKIYTSDNVYYQYESRDGGVYMYPAEMLIYIE